MRGSLPSPAPRLRAASDRCVQGTGRCIPSRLISLSLLPLPSFSLFPTYFSHHSSLPFPGTAAGCFLTPRSLLKDLPGGSSALPVPWGTLHTKPEGD